MRKVFEIGDFTFAVTYPMDLEFPEHFLLFEENECEVETVMYEYVILFVEDLQCAVKDCADIPIATREDLMIYRTSDGREARQMGIRGTKIHYAYYKEDGDSHATIYLEREQMKSMSYDTFFSSLFALERRLIEHDGMVLHSSYMMYQDMAILFTAPSGTGKSTQANLWEQYRGGVTLNGDRSLLQKIDGIWMAHGWPVCGSSEICNNITIPIKSIVVLSQAKVNKVRRLDVVEAFKQIYAQITINGWNSFYAMKAMDLIENLIENIPVYHLSCDISEQAVKCLEESML